MGWSERDVVNARRWPLTAARVALGLALGLLLLQLGLGLYAHGRLAGATLIFPYPLEYSEGPLLDQVLRLSRFETIYPADFSAAPFTITSTPPLFQLIQVPLAAAFGPAYWYGRTLSLLSALAAAVLLGLILHALTSDWVAAVVAGLTWLSFPYLVPGSLFARGDTLALALGLAAVYGLVRAPGDRPPRAAILWVCGLLLTAAVYTQPSIALAAALTAFIWLWQGQWRRAALRLLAIGLGSALGLFAALNLLTRGGFYVHVVAANVSQASARAVAANLAALYLNAGFLLIGCLLYVMIERWGERTRAWPLVTSYLAGAVLTVLGAGRSGPEMMVMAAALCLAAGASLAWAGERPWVRCALILVLAVQAGQLARWSRSDYQPVVAGRLGQQRALAELAALVRQAPDPLLADFDMGLLPLAGRRVYFQPAEFLRLEAAGRWSSAPLVAAIERQAFSAILLHQPRLGPGLADRWAPELRNAIYAHYASEQTLAETLIYLPHDSIE